MVLSDKAFEVLDTLERQPIINQRQLAQHAGISLGQVNYILKSLLGKGFVKMWNFRKSPRKIGYAYLLTPKGIQAKSRLAVRFITSKLEEYDSLRTRLAEKLTSIESRNARRIAFVGPQIVKDFIVSIIVEKKLNLVLTGYFRDCRELTGVNTDPYDVVLVFDNMSGGLSKIAEATAMPKHKLLQLW